MATDKTKPATPDPGPVAAVPEVAEPQAGQVSPERAAAVAEEYGQLVAVAPIRWNGALAFAPGHRVPASHPGAARWIADGSVKRVD